MWPDKACKPLRLLSGIFYIPPVLENSPPSSNARSSHEIYDSGLSSPILVLQSRSIWEAWYYLSEWDPRILQKYVCLDTQRRGFGPRNRGPRSGQDKPNDQTVNLQIFDYTQKTCPYLWIHRGKQESAKNIPGIHLRLNNFDSEFPTRNLKQPSLVQMLLNWQASAQDTSHSCHLDARLPCRLFEGDRASFHFAACSRTGRVVERRLDISHIRMQPDARSRFDQCIDDIFASTSWWYFSRKCE